jgi:hypothetical protein
LAVVAVETKVKFGYSGGNLVGNFGWKFKRHDLEVTDNESIQRLFNVIVVLNDVGKFLARTDSHAI